MFLDFLNENDWSSYILIASILVSLATSFSLLYLSYMCVKKRTTLRPSFRNDQDFSPMKAQLSHNEQTQIRQWLAICIRRKECSDDSPSNLLLESNLFFTIQGGIKWIKNQIMLHPLLLEDSAF